MSMVRRFRMAGSQVVVVLPVMSEVAFWGILGKHCRTDLPWWQRQRLFGLAFDGLCPKGVIKWLFFLTPLVLSTLLSGSILWFIRRFRWLRKISELFSPKNLQCAFPSFRHIRVVVLVLSSQFSSIFVEKNRKIFRFRNSFEREVSIVNCDRDMKRAFDAGDSPTVGDEKMKKRKGEEEKEIQEETGFLNFDEDLLFEVLKHVDARSLATAACVSKQWCRTVQDERLWEIICTRHWANIGCGDQRLRSVVLALGGFRRLHSQCLWPLLKPPSSPLSPFPPPVIPSKAPTRWGKDEVHLSLSLLSIRHYEKMDLSNRGR
ncbi:hypothetical protein HHK36_002653 [Tetracentron sinense]|uniref:F-box protein GID2 n=1 Tax=Tetracentron sinense TaxID=13715 RepID=A0A835DNJ0_TETSI|nr:hypothetical protein HHK36_002653 [Tetracentron sinense]